MLVPRRVQYIYIYYIPVDPKTIRKMQVLIPMGEITPNEGRLWVPIWAKWRTFQPRLNNRPRLCISSVSKGSKRAYATCCLCHRSGPVFHHDRWLDCCLMFFTRYPWEHINVHPWKLTWQWIFQPFSKMYLLLKNADVPACHVSFWGCTLCSPDDFWDIHFGRCFFLFGRPKNRSGVKTDICMYTMWIRFNDIHIYIYTFVCICKSI